MFTYIDPTVRERLLAAGKLQRIDRDGRALSILGPIPLPLALQGVSYAADWYASVRHTELAQAQQLADELREKHGQQSFAELASSMAVNSVLVFGDAARWQRPLIRVHSSCLTGDVFGSCRCECGPQLAAAVDQVSGDSDGGMIVYMSGHEGRGIGLWAKAATYVLQDSGENTYQANRSLGLPDDCRDFSDAATLIHHFVGERPIRLLTNNPKKVDDLRANGIQNITRVKHVIGVGDTNRRYLEAKKDWGHEIDDADLT